MTRKPVIANRGRGQSSPPGEGMVADLIDRVFENPAMSGGLMVMALTASAIVSNALFLQNGHHPDPLFTTRPQIERQIVVPPVAGTPVDTQKAPPVPLPVVAIPPLPRLAPVAPPPAATAQNEQLITAIQRELARLGLYSGAIDGLTGSRTTAAISAYERAAGLAVTGLPTGALLGAMKAPLRQPASRPAATANADYVATAADLDRRAQDRATEIAADQRARADANMRDNYKSIQQALNRIGYGPISIDGTANAETNDAIRRFELDNGLPINGDASDALVGKLIAIGAIKPN